MNKVKVSVVALALGLSAAAQAQVGSGTWGSYSPSFNTQIMGCGAISGSTFTLSCANTSGVHRAERRYVTFTSGTKQFQGTVRVNSLGGDRISVQQTFGTGPHSIIGVRKPGSFYQVRGGGLISNYTIGSSARINAIAFTGSGQVANYVNGSLRQTQTGGGSSLYFKLGAYRTDSGRGPVSVSWSGISFYQR